MRSLKILFPQRILIFLFVLTAVVFLTKPVYSAGEERPLPGFSQNERETAVKEVVSADTIILDNDKKVVLIGLSAPKPPRKPRVQKDQFGFEIVDHSHPETPIEEQAFNFAKDLLEGKKVRLEFDEQSRDEHYDTLAYVFLADGTFANAEILRQGFANLKIRPPNLKYADRLRAAYREAWQEKRGLQGE